MDADCLNPEEHREKPDPVIKLKASSGSLRSAFGSYTRFMLRSG